MKGTRCVVRLTMFCAILANSILSLNYS